MKEFARKRRSREALKHRQVEIQQCLAEFGLWRGARRLLRNARAAHEQATHCERLRASLIKLGPVFSSFGIYLSSRVDLLPASYCLELSTIPDRGPATPIVAVRELLTREIGCSPDEAYFAFEDEPFECRLLFQSHRAWLSQVEPVTVKVIHCELEEYLTFDVGLLALVRSVFDGTGLTKSQIASAVSDFRSTLEREINFVGEASALEQYCQDSKGFEMLKAPTVYLPLCSANVLTIERLPGVGLDNMLSPLRKQRTEENRLVSDGFEASGLDPANVAHNLYIVWLRQALMGLSFPVAPCAENILVLPTRQIAFTGGLCSSLPSTAQARIYNYLVAIATEDTDRACSCLLKETNKEKGACSEDDLLHRFRQVVPFRDGGWSTKGTATALSSDCSYIGGLRAVTDTPLKST
jgi:predicted unusual protein kinase regulating ubiquinone biosynthesis (AarF/ABC1/UbiB family)